MKPMPSGAGENSVKALLQEDSLPTFGEMSKGVHYSPAKEELQFYEVCYRTGK